MVKPIDLESVEVFQSVPEDSGYDYVKTHKDSDEAFDQTPNDPAASFGVFAGHYFDPSGLDYSDSTVKVHLQRKNYLTFKPAGERLESPLERYNRLTKEMEEFKASLATSKDDVPQAVLAELAGLQTKMEATAQDKKYSHLLAANYPLTEADLAQKNVFATLKSEMGNFGKAAASAKPASSPTEGAVTVELYGATGGSSKETLVSLDGRLAKLETAVGSNGDTPRTFPNLTAGVAHLDGKLSLLTDDKETLDEHYRKMKSLIAELDALEQQRQQTDAAKPSSHEKNVLSCYTRMPQWDIAALQLPLIVARMQTLKDMADAGKGAMAKVQQTEKEHKDTAAMIKDTRALLTKVTASVSENLSTMSSTLATIDGKFVDMKAKMAKFK